MSLLRVSLLLVLCCWTLRASAEPAKPVRLVAVGDLAFAWNVGRAIRREQLDPFADVKDLLSSADITFGNLETVLSDRPVPDPEQATAGPILKGPGRAAALIAQAGFDVVSMANNHIFDLYAGGVHDTLGHLHDAGVVEIGGGETPEQAAAPHIRVVHGLKIGFLAFAFATNRHAHGPGYVAILSSHSVDAVRALRGQVDVLLVSLHWGTQYVPEPSAKQVRLAHDLIDAGADAILGHHPHVLQSVEVYRKRPIIYSLGNFVFGWQPRPRNYSAVLELGLAAGPCPVTHVALVPAILRGRHGNPVLCRGADGQAVRDRLQKTSARFHTDWKLVDGALEVVLPASKPPSTS